VARKLLLACLMTLPRARARPPIIATAENECQRTWHAPDARQPLVAIVRSDTTPYRVRHQFRESAPVEQPSTGTSIPALKRTASLLHPHVARGFDRPRSKAEARRAFYRRGPHPSTRENTRRDTSADGAILSADGLCARDSRRHRESTRGQTFLGHPSRLDPHAVERPPHKRQPGCEENERQHGRGRRPLCSTRDVNPELDSQDAEERRELDHRVHRHR